MHSRLRSVAAGVLAAASAAALLRAQSVRAPVDPPISFEKDIQPILEKSCLSCHGETMQGRLDLRSRDSALKGGARGADIVPGDGEGSRLYRRVAGAERPAMPAQADPLTAEQVAAIKRWIDQGARWGTTALAATPGRPSAAALASLENRTITPEERSYWAFKLPVQAPLPEVDAATLTNPIDRFLEQARQERGLKAAPRADRHTLVRRAYLDLTGLPPTPAQVEAFVTDRAPNAWEHLIDTLLASPHYGERYGRMWLDVARYADSAGFEYDMHRPNAWRYRDYVIKSFNDDKPYTQFLVEQIAGDEMDGRSPDTLVATGFLRMGPRVLFREKDNPERRYDYLDEIIGTIGKGTLGLTVNCARCHNHKFDPIAQKDYYSLEASLFGYVETEVPLAPKAEGDAYLAKNAELTAKIAELRGQIEQIERPFRERLQLERIKKQFPEHIVQVVSKPEADRTPGDKLLVEQVLKAASVSGAQVDRVLSPAAAQEKKDLATRIAALDKERPKPLPMAEIVTDGDYRSSPLGEGDDTISCPKCRVPVPGAGPFLHTGPGRYQVPPSYFLIGGDVERHGSLMKPGFVEVITFGNPPTEIPRPDGRTSGRRLALAQWIDVTAEPDDGAGDRESALAEAFWPGHRRHARELRQDGRAADASGAPGLDGRRADEQRMEPEADQQADDDVGGVSDDVVVRRRRGRQGRSGERLSVALPAAAPRRRDRARQHADRGRQHQPADWRRADLSVHAQRSAGQPVSRQVGEYTGWTGGVAPRRVCLPAPVASVSHVRDLRPSGHERDGWRAARVDGADAGAHALEQPVRAGAS
jgi:mono/diheme cytochrome c family protein